MYGTGFRAQKVNTHDFAMVPSTEVPRSKFRMQHQHKTTIGGGFIFPHYCTEVLPGDTFNVRMSAYCRLSTPIYPILDNVDLEFFWFFVPCRLVWVHWQNFMGEQNNPTDSISYTVPTITSPTNGFTQLSLYDYFGLPTAGQTAIGNTIKINALPIRAYNLIFDQWFRDQNLVVSQGTGSGGGSLPAGADFRCLSDDGPDPSTNYTLYPPAKRHDYFTSCLPWTQKGGTAVTLPLGTAATVRTNASNLVTGNQTPATWLKATSGAGLNSGATMMAQTGATNGIIDSTSITLTAAAGGAIYPANLYADLSTATAATINQIRLAFQTQRFLERDARGGTRYTEIVRNHFKVNSPDARLQRPEFLGGGKIPVIVAPVPQTSGTGASGTTAPVGTLSGAGTARGTNIGFNQSFTEHGYILGLVVVRRDQIYQQGIRKLWSRSTRYDFPWPVFSHLGEQSVLNQEIYSDGSANDALTFGYQERYAEMRYHPSYTSAYFRSTNSTPLDAWHLATKFASLPALNQTFIGDDTNVVLDRALAAGPSSEKQQVLCDFFYDEIVARPLPAYGVPGLVDHF